MKTFTQYLSESKKEYAFRILFSAKPAADIKDHIKKTLAGYSVKRVGEIKTKLPAREHPLFTGIENPEIFTCDVVCDYPATADMIRKSITDFAIDKANVAVETLEHAESVAAEDKAIAENTSDTALLMKEYKADKHKSSDFYGSAYNDKLVKNSVTNTGKVTISGGNTPPAKTTNDIEGNQKSAMGSVKPNLPKVKSFFK